ncbi:MAG: hypothetical protein U0900_15245 [Myxococcota bacterium]
MRVRLSSRLAAEIRYSELERTAELAHEALAEARQLGDPAVLAQTLDDCTFVQWTPSDPKGWIDLNLEVVERAREANDLDLEISGHKGCASGRLELGDFAGAQQAIRACDRIAHQFPTPYARWWSTVFRASRALMDGEWERAEELVLDSLRIADRIDAPEVAIEVQAQLVYLRTEQGRASEIETAVNEQVRRFPEQRTWSAAFARVLVASGRLEAAREAIRPLAERRFSDVPLDRGWFGTQALSADVVSRLGDERSAEWLAANLRPYSARTIVIGSAVYYGPVAHYLGLLAATRGDWDGAIGFFDAALAEERRVGARVFAARTSLACARALRSRGREVDRMRSAELTRKSLESAKKRRLVAVLREAEAYDVPV